MSGYLRNLSSGDKENTSKSLRSPLTYSDSKIVGKLYQNSRRSSDDLNFVTKAFYIVFFSFACRYNSKLKEFIRKLIEHGTTLFLIYVVSSDLYSIYIVFELLPMGLTFSSLVTDFCSFTIRIVLLYKKTSMMLAMNFIQDSYAQLAQNDVATRRLQLIIAFSACFVIPIANYVFLTFTCFENEYYVQIMLFGWYPENFENVCYILLSLDVVTLNQQYALPGFAVVLCCYIFGVLARFVDEFGRQLKRQNDIQEMYFYIKYSRIIYSCIEKLEDSFSFLLVFLYGYMTCSIFNVTTTLIRINYEITELISLLPEFVTLIMVLPAFFIMSIRATSINDAAVRIKRTVHELVSRVDISEQAQSNLLLEMADDFQERVVVTGWGLFALKRSFIQRTAGLMITYSIILSQLGK